MAYYFINQDISKIIANDTMSCIFLMQLPQTYSDPTKSTQFKLPNTIIRKLKYLKQ